MNIEKMTDIGQVEDFLLGADSVEFTAGSSAEASYQWILSTLVKFRYRQLGKREKGIMVQFICKVTGYSRQQVTRLISQYVNTGKIVRRQRAKNGFKRRYEAKDIVLLAKMDARHHQPNGATIKKLCERMYKIYGDKHYECLSTISVSHIYNLRQSDCYQRQRRQFDKTKASASTIGTRRKPQPEGKPGYIRIDTVHQGDLDGKKGVYHINAVDEVTQFEIVVSVEKISERYLLPALKEIIDSFPFVILGIHADNGSEYINHAVAKLLRKLLIELTKSRPRRSNDNALAESKNGAIVRKIFGYVHIQQQWADTINVFNRQFLNPYLNYHRPCFFAVITTNKKGKQVKQYPYEAMMTPYEKLKSLDNATQYLREGVSFKELNQLALSMDDNKAADQLCEERKRLFKLITEQNEMIA